VAKLVLRGRCVVTVHRRISAVRGVVVVGSVVTLIPNQYVAVGRLKVKMMIVVFLRVLSVVVLYPTVLVIRIVVTAARLILQTTFVYGTLSLVVGMMDVCGVMRSVVVL
jgi:hypothetical protein